jgi:hypothetical protein
MRTSHERRMRGRGCQLLVQPVSSASGQPRGVLQHQEQHPFRYWPLRFALDHRPRNLRARHCADLAGGERVSPRDRGMRGAVIKRGLSGGKQI